jgi:hypothetical protein
LLPQPSLNGWTGAQRRVCPRSASAA